MLTVRLPFRCSRHLILGTVLAVLCALPEFAAAQVPRPRGSGGQRPLETNVSVELISGSEGVGLRAQEWLRVFEGLGIEFRVRRGLADEKPGVTEKMIGTSLREVRVLGRLERDGSINVGDRRFRTSDVDKLKEWLNTLRVYGAQGSPEGQPLWGLSNLQFAPLLRQLSQKLDHNIQGLTLGEALARLELPADFPLRESVSAAKHRRELPATQTVRQELKGLAKGTALAILLNEYGLGYRPRRTPAGEIELEVVPLSETSDVWPAGWPLKTREPQTVPQLYKIIPIALEEVPLDDVLDAAADFIGVPIYVNHYALAVDRIDLSEVLVSHPDKKTTWSLALKTLTFQARCRPEVWMDEAGTPFVWVTPLSTRRKTADQSN